MSSKKVSLLTSNHKRNLFLFILVPVLVAVLWSQAGTMGAKKVEESRQSRDIGSIRDTINKRTEVYNLLKESVQDYEESDVLEGFVPVNYVKYFSPKLKAPVVVARASGTGTAAPIEPPVVWPADISFIYIGETANYAIIDGVFQKEGSLTPTGFTVAKIEHNRVLIKGKRSERWITLKF